MEVAHLTVPQFGAKQRERPVSCQCHGPLTLIGWSLILCFFWSGCPLPVPLLSLCVCVFQYSSLCTAPGLESFPALKPATPADSHTHQLLMSLDSNTLFKRVAELQSMLDRCVILSVKHWLAELSDSLALIVKRNSNYSVLFCQEIKWESVEHHL